MILVKILEPIGLNDQKSIAQLKNETSCQISAIDTRGFDDQRLIDFAKDAQVLMLSNRPLSKKVIEAMPGLQFISVAFTGVDHIPMDLCQQRKIWSKMPQAMPPMPLQSSRSVSHSHSIEKSYIPLPL